uniref:Uncharacterized protein n=1 Tax=Sphaerodactylus townsendi TaxID=933632 RepID=A0ACB8FF16_9SAUR
MRQHGDLFCAQPRLPQRGAVGPPSWFPGRLDRPAVSSRPEAGRSAMLACRVSRPLPSSLVRFLAAGAGPPPAARGASAREPHRSEALALELQGQELGSQVASKSCPRLPRLPCPEDQTPRDPPTCLPHQPSKLRLWPNPEHAGRRHRSHEGRSRRAKTPTFAATAVAAAGVAFCYSKNHMSKGEQRRGFSGAGPASNAKTASACSEAEQNNSVPG